MAAKAVTFAAVNNAQRTRVRWVEKGEGGGASMRQSLDGLRVRSARLEAIVGIKSADREHALRVLLIGEDVEVRAAVKQADGVAVLPAKPAIATATRKELRNV